jgi:hypothetical protein
VTPHDEKDKGADHMDWDPGIQAMLSLPHLPCMHSLGFCALPESPHMCCKGLLFLWGKAGTNGQGSSPLVSQAAPGRHYHGVLWTAGVEVWPRLLRVQLLARAHAGEATITLGCPGSALSLVAEYSQGSGHLHLQQLHAEGQAGGASAWS